MASENHNFLNLPERLRNSADSRVHVLGLPYEATTTYMKGTHSGPLAIIEASHQIELYDAEIGVEVSDLGISTSFPIDDFDPDPEQAIAQTAGVAESLLAADKFLVALGGEHSITIGLVRAFVERFADLWVLQLDAHSDLRMTYLGSAFNHACVMARVHELCPYIGMGIRSSVRDEREAIAAPSRILYAHEMRENRDAVKSALEELGADVYVTIDLDFFDPATVPSVGTPEPGGFDWYDACSILRDVARSRKIVGFDVVELAPQRGFVASDFLAAKLVCKLLGYIFSDELKKGSGP